MNQSNIRRNRIEPNRINIYYVLQSHFSLLITWKKVFKTPNSKINCKVIGKVLSTSTQINGYKYGFYEREFVELTDRDITQKWKKRKNLWRKVNQQWNRVVISLAFLIYIPYYCVWPMFTLQKYEIYDNMNHLDECIKLTINAW